jgi:hypothetical protein
MANVLLATGNLADAAILSGGSWLTALPLANLQGRQLGDVARSTDTLNASTKLDVDLTGARIIRTFAIANHSISLNGRYRLRFGDDPAFSLSTYDSGWQDVWPTIYPFGSLAWGDPAWWGGKISAEDAASYTATLIVVMPDSYSGRYLRLEIDDTGNTAGYVDLGRLFVADAWQPARNMVYGASIGFIDRTGVQEALSGAEYFTERRNPRTAKIDFTGMSQDEAMGSAYELQRVAGTSREVLFIFDPDDTIHAIRRRWLGRLRSLNALENPGPNRWRTPFEIKELL